MPVNLEAITDYLNERRTILEGCHKRHEACEPNDPNFERHGRMLTAAKVEYTTAYQMMRRCGFDAIWSDEENTHRVFQSE